MTNIWDDLIKWLDDASKVVGKEAGDLTKKGSLKLEIFDLKRKLRDSFTELGSRVYESVYLKKKDNWQTAKSIKSAVQRIKKLDNRLKKRNAEYANIGKEEEPTK
ncbi:hypothetical protein IBX73_07720 [candidate division WOR-3 bacterium]|nr:hypothetical protein [candidate division WOR-3 bacterium]